MLNIKANIFGLVGLLLSATLGACWDINCDNLFIENTCHKRITCQNSWLVTGFDREEEDWEFCKKLGSWMEPNKDFSLSVSIEIIDSIDPFAEIRIDQNDGNGEDGWTGGGPVLDMAPEESYVDISCYDSLILLVQVSPVELRNYLKIKLEDTAGSNRPSLTVAGFGLKTNPGWHRVSIPLSRFARMNNPPGIYPLQLDLVTRMVMDLTNDGSAPEPVDGLVAIDEIRFVKR